MTEEKAPEIRGLHLLMGFDEMNKFFDFPIPQADEFGFSKAIIENNANSTTKSTLLPNGTTYINTLNNPEFKGVRRIYLDFVDGKISKIVVYYFNEAKWTSVDEFAESVGKSLRLEESWEKANESYKQIKCDSVFISAGIDNDLETPNTKEKLPFVKIESIRLDMTVVSRRAEKARKTAVKDESERDKFKL